MYESLAGQLLLAAPAQRAVDGSEPLHFGGPVQPGSIVFLAEFVDPDATGGLMLGRIGFPLPRDPSVN